MQIDLENTVGSFVSQTYKAADVFEKYGIDFCCKGGKKVTDACADKGIDSTVVAQELEKILADNRNASSEFNAYELDELADYIEKTHHAYVEESIPLLKAYLDKIAQVHGGRHPELLEIRNEFYKAAGALAQHMKKEELILFPFVRKMVKAKNAEETIPQAPFGSVENPISMMEHEHDTEGERFRKISELANNYTPPADACTTYRVAFAKLEEFEKDLHKHIHLENNILFPKALRMQNGA